MSVSLMKKGAAVSLEKGLTSVLVGLGWTANDKRGTTFDLDASAFLLGENEKVRCDEDFIFYGNPISLDCSVKCGGDNKVGSSGQNDDETIFINLGEVHEDVKTISIVVSIHNASLKKQNFGMITKAYARLVDQMNKEEKLKFVLSEEMGDATAVNFAKLIRNEMYPNLWVFKAVGEKINNGLAGACALYGVDVK